MSICMARRMASRVVRDVTRSTPNASSNWCAIPWQSVSIWQATGGAGCAGDGGRIPITGKRSTWFRAARGKVGRSDHLACRMRIPYRQQFRREYSPIRGGRQSDNTPGAARPSRPMFRPSRASPADVPEITTTQARGALSPPLNRIRPPSRSSDQSSAVAKAQNEKPTNWSNKAPPGRPLSSALLRVH